MKLISPLLLALLGWCVLLPGCSTPPVVSGITVSVDGFKRYDAAPGPARGIMTLRFTSENTSAIAFSGSTHRLYLNDTLVGSAKNETPVGLPPMETVTHDVIIELVNPAAIRQALADESAGRPTRYRVESVLRFNDGENISQIKKTFAGTVALLGLETAVR